MKHLFIAISTERKNEIFADEVQIAMKTIKKLVPEKHLRFVSLKSFSLSSKCENLNDVEIFENCIDLESDDTNEIEDLKVNSLNCHQKPDIEEEFIANDFFKLSNILHDQADTFEAATTSLCILWIINKYSPSPSEVVEFYACLQRFQAWHNGSLNIISKNTEMVQDWLQFFPLSIADSSLKVVENELGSFWRGSLAFTVEDKFGFTLYPEVVLTGVHESFNPFIMGAKKEATHSQYILPVCEVFSDIGLGSIPWSYIQRGSLCKLQPSMSATPDQKADIVGLFERMTAYQGVGTLVRIRHSHLPPTLEYPLTSQEWKQRIANGNFDLVPSLRFKGHHQCLVLVVLPDCASKDMVYCIALQDPSVYGEDIVKLVMEESLKPKDVDPKVKEKVLCLMQDTNELTNVQAAAFSHLLLNVPVMIAKKLKKLGQDVNHLWDDTKLGIERAASQEIMKVLLSNVSPAKILPVNKLIPPEISTSKECWPEYQALEEAERQTKKSMSRRVSSGDFLCGIAPPVTSNTIGSVLQVSSILKFFKADGRAKIEQRPTNSIGRFSSKKRKLIQSNLPLKTAQTMDWTEAVHLRHHGLYYNTNVEYEKFESSCDRLQKRCIRNEFLSSCPTFEVIPKFNTKKYKLSLSNRSPQVSNMTSIASSDIDAVSMKSGSIRNIQRIPISPSKLGLRRSPRQRPRDNNDEGEMRTSDLMKPKTARPKLPRSDSKPPMVRAPQDLSDIHKRKLRNAIAEVLATEGINEKHHLFKLCFKKMFLVCRPFALDVVEQRSSTKGQRFTTNHFETIAKSHVKQVVDFERRKNSKRL